VQINKSQLKQIGEARDLAYARSAARYYKVEFPRAVSRVNLEDLERWVIDALHAARRIGIVSSEATTAYVGLAVLAGPKFLDDEEIRYFLRQQNFQPDQQVRKLLIRVISKLEQLRDSPAVTQKA
jgi:hypothetical protein